MSKIKQLSPDQARKIAAGQVVDRPANVVKELVENSIDAGATKIEVHIEGAGSQLVRVVDNGCGMNEQDAIRCFDHHATSKITRIEQLQEIDTFGFRGEALASIAAVSTVTLITKESTSDTGVKLVNSQGTLSRPEPTACPNGTIICVANLFDNVPARKKFLKKASTEWRHIQQLVHAFCFDYINVHFKLFADGRQVLNCPPTNNVLERVHHVWDATMAQHMITAHNSPTANITVTGIISNHQLSRFDRSHVVLFVNKRWVKDSKLSQAVIKGYQNVLPHGRFPAAILFIELPQTDVDINIHPRKEEVQFAHPRRVTTAVHDCVKMTLEAHLSAQLNKDVSLASTPDPFGSLLEQTPPAEIGFARKASVFGNQQAPPADPLPFASVITPQQVMREREGGSSGASADIQINHINPLLQTNYRIIGNLHRTYILVEQDDGLFMVDQHAAHERILYEKFLGRFDDVATVQLMFPEIVPLPADELRMVEPHLPMLQQFGIGAEPFGSNQIKVTATPVNIKHINLKELLQYLVSLVKDGSSLSYDELIKMIHERMRAQMACKAAVKAGDELTEGQMRQLLDDLAGTKNRLTCPHGRPTGWKITGYELEKKFKRKN